MKWVLSVAGTSLLSLLLMSSCGEESAVVEEGTAAGPAMRTISIVDSIGVELGDSNYVFASIEATGHTLDGNILVLDRPGCRIREFTPDGDFVRQFGRRGSGPGELANPHSMARLADGRIAVLDVNGAGLQTYLPDGEWEGVIQEVLYEPVLWLTEAEENCIVGTHNSFDFGEDGLIVTAVVAKWTIEETEPVEVYWQNSFVWDFQNITPLIEGSYFAQTWASNREGYVFLAPRTSEEYRVTGYDPSGEPFVEITQDLPSVRKSAEEIADEAAFWNMRAENMGANGPFNYEPDPYRWMIHSMGIDGEGRLWIRRGTEDTPTFDVFDMDGEKLFSAEIPSIGGYQGLLWQIDVDEQGILGYSLDPSQGYQKLYVMELD
jgi:hypothetical protein